MSAPAPDTPRLDSTGPDSTRLDSTGLDSTGAELARAVAAYDPRADLAMVEQA